MTTTLCPNSTSAPSSNVWRMPQPKRSQSGSVKELARKFSSTDDLTDTSTWRANGGTRSPLPSLPPVDDGNNNDPNWRPPTESPPRKPSSSGGRLADAVARLERKISGVNPPLSPEEARRKKPSLPESRRPVSMFSSMRISEDLLDLIRSEDKNKGRPEPPSLPLLPTERATSAGPRSLDFRPTTTTTAAPGKGPPTPVSQPKMLKELAETAHSMKVTAFPSRNPPPTPVQKDSPRLSPRVTTLEEFSTRGILTPPRTPALHLPPAQRSTSPSSNSQQSSLNSRAIERGVLSEPSSSLPQSPAPAEDVPESVTRMPANEEMKKAPAEDVPESVTRMPANEEMKKVSNDETEAVAEVRDLPFVEKEDTKIIEMDAEPRKQDLSDNIRHSSSEDFSEQSLKLELELKEERMRSLKKEIDDLSSSDKGQADINALKRNKHELELRCKEQEEELDDLAGQVQMLEQAKVRLEMSLEQMRKEQRKELQQRDEEMDDVRSSCQKKIKMMEVELEKEREDRTAVVRERHDLERKLNELTAAQLGTESVSVEKVNHLKRELKRTRALLKDAQLMLEREQKDAPSRVLIRQLRNQLEDAEFARTSALKAKQNVDLELQETSAQLEEITRTRNELDSKLVLVAREKAGLQSQLEEHEEEMSDVMKKYKAAVQQLSVDQLTLSDLSSQVSLLESEKNHLREQVAELSLRLETQSSDPTHVHETKRLEMRIKELESRLELEETTRQRLEGQINRLRETVEALSNEGEALRTKEQVAQEACRRAQRSLRDLQEDYASLQMRETEGDARRQEMELTTERLEAEVVTVRSDLKLALQRIQDLQSAMAEATDSSAEGEESDSDSDTSLDTFISSRGYNRKAPTIASSEGEGERDRSLRTEEESFSLLGNQQTESSA
ncbi:unnamed protein product [Cyprideis torosa]|uniref:Myosin tail domain-containing protein n=1 Tax=Cyprideis torosa TaxID=163714 RepID=A0A7R8W678_9CRUS|nr:unnamed protein product [Cyprideis torosa]CAG0880748.1 unnamed protein product [Cyprideis torosa]